MGKIILPFFLVLALLGIFLLSDSFSDNSLHFFGIAGEREQTIGFQYPVEIVQVFGVDGKEVEQGAPMLEVKRQDLDTNRTALDQEIRRYELQKQETNDAITSQLVSLKAKKQAVSADMAYQINVLELRLKNNASMMESLNAGNPGKNIVSTNTGLSNLKRKHHFLVQAIQAEIDHLEEQLNSSIRPIDAQLSELHHRKDELKQQNISLKVNALFNGRIGSVNFKVGELVPPYQPIMSVHSRVPRYVKGYIHENILNNVKVGQSVSVRSLAFNKDEKSLNSTVESMGNRIVEYPERLKKNPQIPAWGREVVIRLNDSNNSLLFGEKVEVLLNKPEQHTQRPHMMSMANASIENTANTKLARPITSNTKVIKANEIEASGILWQANQSHFLLISDEQYQDQSPVFIMDDRGIVSARLGMQQQSIDDLESISSDGNYTYILSSLSHTKKGKLKAKRKKLMRFKYLNNQMIEHQAIDLYRILKQIRDKQPQTKLSSFLEQAIDNHSMNIESHFVRNNQLYLGFKSPFENSNKTLIIRVNNLAALFNGSSPSAEIWKTINLLDPETGEPMQLSDMLLVDKYLFLLSISRSSAKKSVLWHYFSDKELLKKIKQFPGLKAEGITYQTEKSLFTVVFDEGKKTASKYLSFPFSVSAHNP